MFGADKRWERMIKDSFGTNPLEGFLFYNASERMDKVKKYHEAVKEKNDTKWQVDDITWEDLEMDRVFLRINHTNSFIGEQDLYHRLHVLDKGLEVDREQAEFGEGNLNQEHGKDKRKPGSQISENAKKMERRLQYLKEHPEFRLEVEKQLAGIGKKDEGYYLADFLIHSELWQLGNTLLYHILQILLVVSLILSIAFENAYAIALLIFIVLINLIIYAMTKQKYDVFFTSLAEFKKIYDFAGWMKGKDKEGIFVTEHIENSVRSLHKMSRVIFGMNGRRQASLTGDAIAILREYLWGILLIDVSLFNHMMKIISGKQEDVLRLLEFAGRMDSDISILSYRHSVPTWCRPEFSGHGKFMKSNMHLRECSEDGIFMKGIVHPLLEHPVKNDYKLHSKAIITGSNASGKSTFMKSIAINCILAQTIHTCTADRMILPSVTVVTCMALRDDIMTGESYFYREAKYLKRMLQMVEEEVSLLVVVDEILKGTNTRERIAASRAILDYIGEHNCLALIATHDQELMNNPVYENYHFCSKIENDDIVFDYRIHEGVNRETNAIMLLSGLGYPKEIIKMAERNLCQSYRQRMSMLQ